MGGAHLLDVPHLALVVRERVNLSTHRLRPQDGVVSEATDADNADLFARTTAVGLERRVDRQTSAHHRGSMAWLNLLWDGEDETLMSTNSGRVATLGDDAVRILGILCAYSQLYRPCKMIGRRT